MKNKKNKRREGQEQWIEEVLDQADREDLLRISAIHSNTSMPLPNKEKLAWSVIDKAALADEEEMERRRRFQRELRKRKILHGLVGCGVVVIVIAVLALCGLFDGMNLKTYSYTIESASVKSAGDQFKVAQPKVDEQYPSGSLQIYQEKDKFPKVSQDKLENTIYKILAEYCEKNDYAMDDFEIDQTWKRMAGSEDHPILLVDFYGTCLDYRMEDGGKTWEDYIPLGPAVCGVGRPEERMWRYYKTTMPCNMYVVKFQIAIEL